MRKRFSILALTFAFLFIFISTLAAGCGNRGTAAQTPPGTAPEAPPVSTSEADQILSGSIMIAAAASLQAAFEKVLIPLFNETHPGVNVIGTYDSSGKLQTQIENGLDAQIFFSASTKQIDALVEGGFIDEATVVNLLENEVALITGISTDTKVTGFENILDADVIAIGDPGSVPAGQYAEEVLTNLGLWDEVNARASHGTNVTEVLTWVSEGSAEVGIVYMTDAAIMQEKVKVIATAPEGTLITPVVYPVGLQAELGDKSDAAEAFIAFLQSPEALDIFKSYGFKTEK